MAEHTIDSLYIDIESDSKNATQAINKLVSSLKRIKKEIGGGFNTDNLRQSIRSIAELAPTTKTATKEIGSLVSSFKNLKQEMNAGFSAGDFKSILSSLDKIDARTKTIAKSSANFSKLSENIQKATAIKPDSLEQYKESLKGMFSGFKIPDTLPEIEKELQSLGKGYENLVEKQKKAIALNGGIEPDTKSYRTLLYDLSELVAKTQELSKARLEASKVQIKETSEKTAYDTIPDTAIHGAIDSPDTLAKAYDKVTESAEKASEAVASVTSNVPVDDPSPRFQAFMENYEKQNEEAAKNVSSVWEKAFDNVNQNFRLPDSIKDLEKLIPNLQKNLDRVRESFQTAIDTQKLEEGSTAWDKYDYNVNLATEKLEAAKEKLAELIALNKEVENTPVPTPETPKSSAGDNDIPAKTLTATVSFSTLSKYIGQFSKSLDGLSSRLTNLLSNLYLPLRKVVSEYKAKLGEIGNIFKKLGNTVASSTKSIAAKWNNLVHSFSRMVMRRALYAVLQTINDAMGSLANFTGTTGQKFNKAMSEMTSSARYAGANTVAAFSPLVNAIAPMIDALVEKLVSAITVINQFFAALTGNNVYVRAKKVVTDYANSVKDATKAQKDLVLGIDELNINDPNGNNSASGAAGAAYEWEEAPVLNSIQDFADKVNKIFSELFDPLKKAWDKAGDYVISGFKYMAGELSKLAASIGSDFLTMWQEDATVRIFENILGIVGDLEYTVGNLAKNFRAAWEENDVGLHIFENMRDIIGILVEHVRNVTKYMKEWSESIDFKPLLNSINNLLGALKPVADFLGGVFEDVMERVVLRHIKYLTEEGIPHLNDTLAGIADAFDWKKLREDIQPVEDAFENLREAIGTGVTNALGNLGEALAGITNTETFTNFMNNIAGIMNLIDAELVEKVFTALGNVILDIADALVSFVGSEKFTDFLGEVDKYLDSITVEDIEGIIKGLAIAIGTYKFTSFIGSGVVGCLNFFTTISAFTGLGATAGGISAVGSALSFLGTGILAVAATGVSFYGIVTTFKDLNSAIKDGDTVGIITNVTQAILDMISPIAALGDGIGTLVTNSLKSFGLFEKGGKSLRDSLEENVDSSSNKLRDLRKVATDETDTIDKNTSKSWESITTNMSKSLYSINEGAVGHFGTLKKTVSDSTDETGKALNTKWSGIDKDVTGQFSDIAKGAKSSFGDMSKTISDQTKESGNVFDDFVKKLKGAFDFKWELPKLKMPHFKAEGEFSLNPLRVPTISIDWYKSGGFLGGLNSYSLFGAGENGIPEILGTVGGKSAVAGGEEITGIRDQVYQSGVAEQELLNQAISLLQIIANKDFNVELDGRSMVTQLNNRSARNGFSMATVT